MKTTKELEELVEKWNSKYEWIEVKLCKYYINDYNWSYGFKIYESGYLVGEILPNSQKFLSSNRKYDFKTVEIVGDIIKTVFLNKQ